MARIRSYQDLVEEEDRLQNLISIQKDLLKMDVADFKQKINPAKNVLNFLGKFGTRPNRNSMVNVAIDIGTNILFNKVLLRKAGWVTKLAVPFVVKNFSSHALQDKDSWLKKILGRFTLKKKARRGWRPSKSSN